MLACGLISSPNLIAAKKARATIEQLPGADGLALLKIDAKENATVEWEVVCKKP